MSKAEEKKQTVAEERLKREEDERLLNEAFMLTFDCASGRKVLDYLIAKTLHTVNGPNFDSNALGHIEGQRFIVAEIRQRIKNGEQKV